MTEVLPSPLTPADCDLSEYAFMPLDAVRLRDAGIVDAVTGDEFRAAVLLWCAAWHQVPAGSLPDDDAQLSRFAGYGRVIKEWLKVKSGALYGFIKCADGRLYHPIVCEKAIEAHASRKKASKRGRAGASKRWGSQNRPSTENEADKNAQSINSDRPSIDPATENHSKGEEGKGQGEEGKIPIANAIGRDAPVRDDRPDWWPTQDRYGRITSEITEKVMFDVGKAVLGKSSGGQISKLRKAYRGDMRAVTDLLLQAEEKSDPSEWIAGVIRRADHGEPVDPKHEIYPEQIYTDGAR